MTLNELLHHVATEHGLEVHMLRGTSRLHRLVRARVDCYRLLRAKGWSFPRIARVFGRDHSSIQQTLRRHDGWRDMRQRAA